MPSLAPSARPVLASLTAAALAVTGLATGVGAARAADTPPTVRIDSPLDGATVAAGRVRLSGSTAPGAAEQTTSVVYLVDVSGSTVQSVGYDCNGDGAVTPADDVNADSVVGSVLDCEATAVRAVNASLAAASTGGNVRVSLSAFGETATTAALRPDGTEFIAPEETDGATRRVDAVTATLGRARIGAYAERTVQDGTNLDAATRHAIASLADAPPGPRYVFLISDGQSTVRAASIENIRRSGVRIRTFGVGPAGSCETNKPLAQIALASSESCQTVANPAALSGEVAGAIPVNLARVAVSVGDQTREAAIDAVGNWSTEVDLGVGTFTARAVATSDNGVTASASTTFFTSQAALAPAAATPARTKVAVRSPAPTKATLPSRIQGSVTGAARAGSLPADPTYGSTVVLQGRAWAAGPWRSLATTKVRRGAYTLAWKPRGGVTTLRVVYPTRPGLGASASLVPAPPLSSCRKTGTTSWKVTCSTTVRSGTSARLLLGRTVVGTAKVAKGKVTVSGRGAVGRHTLDLRISATKSLRLPL